MGITQQEVNASFFDKTVETTPTALKAKFKP
jgi:hypothetical protein